MTIPVLTIESMPGRVITGFLANITIEARPTGSVGSTPSTALAEAFRLIGIEAEKVGADAVVGVRWAPFLSRGKDTIMVVSGNLVLLEPLSDQTEGESPIP